MKQVEAFKGKSFWFAVTALIALILATTINLACTPQGRATLVTDTAKVAICVAEHQDQPLAMVLTTCATDNVSPDDIAKMLEAQKTATAKAAAKRAGACAPQTDGGK